MILIGWGPKFHQHHDRMGIWTTRTQDNSYPSQLVPRTIRTQVNSYPERLVPKSTRTQVTSCPGQLVHRMIRTQDNSYQRKLLPKAFPTQGIASKTDTQKCSVIRTFQNIIAHTYTRIPILWLYTLKIFRWRLALLSNFLYSIFPRSPVL